MNCPIGDGEPTVSLVNEPLTMKSFDRSSEFQRAIAQSRTSVITLLDAAEAARFNFSHRPADDSLAARERSGQAAFAGEWGEEPIDDCRMIISMLMSAAEFHMWGFCDLVMAEKTGPNTLDVLARAAIENLARALWLSEPSIGATERLKRMQTERLYSAAEEAKLDAERRRDAEERKQRILATAAALGWKSLKSEKGRPKRFVVRPQATELAGQLMLDVDDRGLGKFLYRLLSASTHGTTYALARFIHAIDDHPEGRDDLGVLAVSSTEVNLLSSALVFAYISAMRSWLLYLGWNDDPTWQKAQANSLGAL